MKFEEALALLREGKKIRHPSFEEDVYLMACSLTFQPTGEVIPGTSIVKMKGKFQHPDMLPRFTLDGYPCGRNDLHMRPQIDLLLLIRDDWDVYAEN